MMRFVAGVVSALLFVAAGFFLWQSQARQDQLIPPAPEPRATNALAGPAPPMPPAADEPTREEKRFNRADRDDDGRITLEELFHPRRNAFARLDRNGDGRLAFEEWAVTTSTKFSRADANRDRQLDRTEYATTAPRRRPRRQNCAC